MGGEDRGYPLRLGPRWKRKIGRRGSAKCQPFGQLLIVTSCLSWLWEAERRELEKIFSPDGVREVPCRSQKGPPVARRCDSGEIGHQKIAIVMIS